MTDDPPLLIYRQTVEHLLADPRPTRPGPRHALRADLYARRPSEVIETSAEVPEEHPEYVYTDPVMDPTSPSITEPDDDALPDVFPEGWGEAPTERDQAAIDRGNA
ncbi:hypothetical protein [Pseudonocardia alni]|uniref:hypothetical protein n=1 Tax=Pseudonocardia alni TaxID=33907 RepID=UPI0027992F83|nr:hypothetical protein PaSha_13975 [Pseudonocardia alni]WFG47443.1 hypothetical protein PaSha_28590 [Pseudonocardia alni]